MFRLYFFMLIYESLILNMIFALVKILGRDFMKKTTK